MVAQIPLITGSTNVQDSVNKVINAVNVIAAMLEAKEARPVATNNLFLGSGVGTALSGGFGDNNAVGVNSLHALTTGAYNNALGTGTLALNTDGSANDAIGDAALASLASGDYNNALGNSALYSLTSGSNNTGIGDDCGPTLTSGDDNTLLGQMADVSAASATNQIVIGAGAVGVGNNKAQIGNTSITDAYFGDGTAKLHADGAMLSGVATLDTNGTIVGAAAGVAVAETGGGTLHKSIFTLTNVHVHLANDPGNGAFGSAKLYNFPPGIITLNASNNLIITLSAAGVIAGFDPDKQMTNAAATDLSSYTSGGGVYGMLGSGDAPATAGVFLSREYFPPTISPANLSTRGGNGNQLFLSYIVYPEEETVNITPTDLILNGTVTISWSNAGDF